jgi:hypothetical protein
MSARSNDRYSAAKPPPTLERLVRPAREIYSDRCSRYCHDRQAKRRRRRLGNGGVPWCDGCNSPIRGPKLQTLVLIAVVGPERNCALGLGRDDQGRVHGEFASQRDSAWIESICPFNHHGAATRHKVPDLDREAWNQLHLRINLGPDGVAPAIDTARPIGPDEKTSTTHGPMIESQCARLLVPVVRALRGGLWPSTNVASRRSAPLLRPRNWRRSSSPKWSARPTPPPPRSRPLVLRGGG